MSTPNSITDPEWTIADNVILEDASVVPLNDYLEALRAHIRYLEAKMDFIMQQVAGGAPIAAIIE
jgi:hypothetical protein